MSVSSGVKKLKEPLRPEDGIEIDPRWTAMRAPSDPEQFVMEGWIAPAPFEKLCGIEIVEAGAGRSVLRMPFAVMHSMTAGMMHGGALTTLGDTAIAVAIKSILPEKSHFVTSELTCKFLAPVERGFVTAKANISQYGGKHLVADAVVTDEAGKKVAEFTASFRVIRHGGPAK